MGLTNCKLQYRGIGLVYLIGKSPPVMIYRSFGAGGGRVWYVCQISHILGYKSSCQHFSCQRRGKGPGVEFYLLYLFFFSFFFLIPYIASPLPTMSVFVESSIWKGKDSLPYKWERRSGILICLLHRTSTVNFLFYHLLTCFWMCIVPLFHEFLLVSLARSSLFWASTQPA